ncbi:MAG: hypothetical protein J6Y16_05315, partial [Treponema sp.]|nr:hypothetical protein [Treponema sp.]
KSDSFTSVFALKVLIRNSFSSGFNCFPMRHLHGPFFVYYIIINEFFSPSVSTFIVASLMK